jgi:hypothetical protein
MNQPRRTPVTENHGTKSVIAQQSSGLTTFMLLLKSFACGCLAEIAVLLMLGEAQSSYSAAPSILVILGVCLMAAAAFWQMNAYYWCIRTLLQEKPGSLFGIIARVPIAIVLFFLGCLSCFIAYWLIVALLPYLPSSAVNFANSLLWH